MVAAAVEELLITEAVNNLVGVAVAVVVQDLLILLAALEVATSTNSLEHLSPVQVVHPPQAAQAVLGLPLQTLVIRVDTAETAQEAGVARDQRGSLETILTLLAMYLQPLVLGVLLAVLSPVIPILRGLHLELVWVQFLER